MFTFGLKGGYDAGVKLVSNVKLFSHLANIGDTRSLIIHPASTTHRQLTDAQKVAAGAGPDVVRLSIGIEDKDDIIADLEQALGGLSRRGWDRGPLPAKSNPSLPGCPLRAGHDLIRIWRRQSGSDRAARRTRPSPHARPQREHQHRHGLMHQRERERHLMYQASRCRAPPAA